MFIKNIDFVDNNKFYVCGYRMARLLQYKKSIPLAGADIQWKNYYFFRTSLLEKALVEIDNEKKKKK